MTPIFNEYNTYLTKYKDKYGSQTVVLMQVGSFYEIYAILNEKEQLGEINIYHICQNLMNIAVAKKTNEILMGGFQLPYSGKFIKLLIENNYTIVIVQQITEKPNIERKVVRVISPGTYTEDFNNEVNNYMMSVYIEEISKSFIAVGISIIDVSTGKNYVYQIGENIDNNFWKDELNRLINYYNPREFLFKIVNLDLTEDDIINYWDIQNASIQLNHYPDKAYECIPYQNELLQKVFEFESQVTPIEQLNMVHKEELRKSYIYMLQYIYEHKTDTLRNINLPEDIENIHHLSLTSNSVRQLNIVNNYSYYKGKNESLFSICDDCGFIGGRRLLKERLLYPSINPSILQKRYDRVECLRKDHFYKGIKENINKLTDLDKSLRRMGLGILDPPGFLTSKVSYGFFNRIIDSLAMNDRLTELYDDYETIVDRYVKFYDKINKIFNYNNFYTPDKSYFKKGCYPDIDELDKNISRNMGLLNILSKKFSSIIDTHNSCKVDSNDKYGYFLYCTKNRSKILDKRFKNMPNYIIKISDDDSIALEISLDDVSYKPKDGNNVFIECSEINELTSNLQTYVSKMKSLNQLYWNQIMNELYNEYNQDLQKLHQFISDLDVSSTIAKISIQNNYCKPTLIENDKSCLIAQDIRHPIVERIATDTEYITNDVILGKDNHDGILLFGTNACGKSTLMKAIGLNVILAQAGFYVPCQSFKYKPYTKIFTRILSNDNIFRSQSSFAVEIMELSSIFQLSDENSLILGDELCSGTETKSAISIVSKSLDILSKKRSSYIITSHLHQLNEVSIVKSISNLHIYHLKIIYDNNVLTYDRKLSNGSGPAIYGLKVCEAMGLSDDFIRGSNEILKELTEQSTSIINTKTSNYNKDVFMDECKVCGSMSEETHHIKEQCSADDNGMIDHYHKNKKHNLVSLCKKCHSKVTYGNLIIHGWKETSRGRQLDYESVEKRQVTKPKKFTEEQIEIILGYKQLVSDGDINKITCMNMIDSEHGFRPSSRIITEIFNGLY